MLRDFWNKLMGRERDAAIEREQDLEQMSPAERHFESESIDDIQADAVSEEHLGGFDPHELVEDDEPPRG
jgi:hypothetical protein